MDLVLILCNVFFIIIYCFDITEKHMVERSKRGIKMLGFLGKEKIDYLLREKYLFFFFK